MGISLHRFRQDRGPNGEQLQFPGTVEGFPVVGPNRLLRDAEYEEIPYDLYYQARMFRLWESQDLIDFVAFNQRVVSGLWFQRARHDQWVPEKNHYCVWLEWVQVYGRIEPDASFNYPVRG
jgi:hypothetical protein